MNSAAVIELKLSFRYNLQIAHFEALLVFFRFAIQLFVGIVWDNLVALYAGKNLRTKQKSETSFQKLSFSVAHNHENTENSQEFY